MKRVKLAIFDMDGLMLDTEEMYINLALQVAQENHYPITKDLIEKTIGLNSIASRQVLIEYLGKDFPIDDYNTILREKTMYKITHEEIKKKDGLMELLDYFDRKNSLKAVATSTSRYKAEILLKNSRLWNRFNYVICGDDVKNGKPAPDIYLKVCEDLKISTKDAIVFEDSLNGLKSAYSAGIRCILVPDKVDIPEEARKLAYKIYSSLCEVIL